MNNKPFFIALEGIDGSGKSTQCDLLFQYISSMGLPAVKLAEPTGGKWGCAIRDMLKKKEMSPAGEQLKLFLNDRLEDANKNINPALHHNKIIVMDRYYYSNVAYQGAAGISPDYIISENKKICVPEPNRVYFIDIPVEMALQRVMKRKDKDKEIFEKESFLHKVREIFLSISDDSFLIIDGTRSIDAIFKIIKNDFDRLYFNE